jgi:hypothetical protein
MTDGAARDGAVPDAGTTDGAIDGALDDAAVDAPAPEACTMEGATRVADCGMCGSRSESCTGGVWVSGSECLGQGECAVAAVDEQTTPMCVTQQRICSASCRWGAWEDVTTGGECQPGEVRVVPRAGCTNQIVERCADACTWEPQYAEGCGPCGAPPRTDLDLLCIPTNDVLLNRTTDPTSETFPATVSYFWIMRYPVTQTLKNQCMREAACTIGELGPEGNTIAAGQFTLAGALPQQDELCAWIGGRSPRLAEWTLAARGPAPRAATYPWWNGQTGDRTNDLRTCETVPLSSDSGACPEHYPSLALPLVDGLPWTRSFFGVDAMVGTTQAEIVSDAFQPSLGDSYDRVATPGLHDPTGPGAPTGTFVGGGLADEIGVTWRSTDDRFDGEGYTIAGSQLRCVFEVTR